MRSQRDTQSEPLTLDPVDELTEAERLRVDALLDALVQPRLECELVGQDAAVRAIAARVRPRRRPPSVGVPRVSLGFLIPRRPAAGLAVAACLFAATTGGAFAGVLPSAAQRVAHRAFDRLGVDVPGGAQHADAPQTPGGAVGSTGGGVSSTARDRSTSGRDKGAKVSNTASHGTGKAGDDHGAATDPAGPPETTGSGDPAGGGGADNGQGTTRSQAGAGNGQGATHSGGSQGQSGGGQTHSGGGTQPSPPAPGGGGQSGTHGGVDKSTQSAQ